MALRGAAAFVYTDSLTGYESVHLLAEPLREVKVRFNQRSFSRSSLDLTATNVVTVGDGVWEIEARIRYNALPEDLLLLLRNGRAQQTLRYYPDLTASEYLEATLVIPDEQVLEVEPDADRWFMPEYEVLVLLRKTAGTLGSTIRGGVAGRPLVMRLRGGGNITDWTFSRASTGYRIAKDGTLESIASGKPRIDWLDVDEDGVREVPGWLLEPASTNQITDQAAFGSWTGVQIASVTADAVTVAGVACDKIIPNTTSAAHFVRKATAGNATAAQVVIVQAFVAKGGGYNACSLRFVASGAFSAGQQARFDLDAETATVTSGAGTAGIEQVSGDLYRVWLYATAANTGVVTTDLLVYNGATESYAGDGTKGLYAWLAIVEFNRQVPTSPFTASSRAVDILSRTLPAGVSLPTDSWARYTRWAPGMDGDGGLSASRVWEIGATGGAFLTLYWSTAGTLSVYHTNNGSTSNSVNVAVTVVRGDTVEALVVWNGDGTGTLIVYVNGVSAGSASLSGIAPAGAWNGSATTYVNSRASGSSAGAMTLRDDIWVRGVPSGNASDALVAFRTYADQAA